MEKIIYPLWKSSELDDKQFRTQLLGPMTESLIAAGVHQIRISVVDDDVTAAAPYRIEASKPPINAMLSLWVDSAIYRQPLEVIMSTYVARYEGYLVSESEPLVNSTQVASVGERTPGMNQVVFLRKPPRMHYEQWLDIWLNSHTRTAIETQSTFGYRQNIVVRALTYTAPNYDAIIEENFPAAAMTDRMAFYNASGNEALYKEREQKMLASCSRFIDFDKIDCIPTSEYLMKP